MSVSAPVKLTIKDYKSDLHNDWCPGCVAPATRIVTRAGSAPIADIKVGDEVLGHDGAFHRVTETMSHWHEAPMRRVTVQGLGDLTVTDDHPVYTVKRARRHATNARYEPDWTLAKDVKRGDYVGFPIPMDSADQPWLSLWYERKFKDTRSKALPDSVALDDRFLRLAGYYIAEGHTHRREIGLTFSAQEWDLARDTVELVGDLFELTATVRDRTAHNNTIEVAVSSSYLAEIFANLFGTGAENKRVPEPLMKVAPHIQRSLLRG